jgi:glycosyltransferase involved in cell wall biosynthesis
VYTAEAMPPLVSCVLVTKDRPQFVAQALRCFAAQDYPAREIVVVDDGKEPVEALCKGVRNLTYLRLTCSTPTGAKLNLGITQARGGIIQKLDDDDYYGPAFLSTAVTGLRGTESRRALVAWCCFFVLIAGHAQLCFSGHGWHAGGTLCFRRSLWQRRPFRDLYASSDSWFIRDHQADIVRVCAPEQYMLVRHGRNTWQRVKAQADTVSVESYFRRIPERRSVRTIVGAQHHDFYKTLMTDASGIRGTVAYGS